MIQGVESYVAGILNPCNMKNEFLNIKNKTRHCLWNFVRDINSDGKFCWECAIPMEIFVKSLQKLSKIRAHAQNFCSNISAKNVLFNSFHFSPLSSESRIPGHFWLSACLHIHKVPVHDVKMLNWQTLFFPIFGFLANISWTFLIMSLWLWYHALWLQLLTMKGDNDLSKSSIFCSPVIIIKLERGAWMAC